MTEATCNADWAADRINGPGLAEQPSETCPEHGRKQEPESAAVLPTDACRGCDYQTAPVGAPCPICGSLDRVNEVTLRWNRTVPQSFAEALLDTDWEALAMSLPGLEAAMVSRMREQAQYVREHRVRDFVFDDNDPIDEADIADLTRRLALISDVLGRFGKSLTGVSKAALQEIAVDALETKLARVKVPLSEGGPTVVATRQTEIKTTFKDDRILAVLAEMAVAEHGVARLTGTFGVDVGQINPLEAYEAGLRAGCRYGVSAAVDMRTSGTWKITAVKGLAETLLARGSDRLAKIMKTAFDQTKDFTDEYKVTIEQPK